MRLVRRAALTLILAYAAVAVALRIQETRDRRRPLLGFTDAELAELAEMAGYRLVRDRTGVEYWPIPDDDPPRHTDQYPTY